MRTQKNNSIRDVLCAVWDWPPREVRGEILHASDNRAQMSDWAPDSPEADTAFPGRIRLCLDCGHELNVPLERKRWNRTLWPGQYPNQAACRFGCTEARLVHRPKDELAEPKLKIKHHPEES